MTLLWKAVDLDHWEAGKNWRGWRRVWLYNHAGTVRLLMNYRWLGPQSTPQRKRRFELVDFHLFCGCSCDSERAERFELAGKLAAASTFGLCSATEHGRQCWSLAAFLQLPGLVLGLYVGLLSLAWFIELDILRLSWRSFVYIFRDCMIFLLSFQ